MKRIWSVLGGTVVCVAVGCASDAARSGGATGATSDAASNIAGASWYRNEGLGRVFYTDFAKVDVDLKNPALGPHIVAGLSWVLGMP